MNQRKMTLAQKLPELDTEKINHLLEKITRDSTFIDSEGRIKEPYGSVIFLRLVGRMPARTASILHFLSKRENEATRSELANILGFSEGAPYVRFGEWLGYLVKLGLLKEGTVKPFGKKKMKTYKLKEMELHRFCQNLHNLFTGEEFEWSFQHLLRIIKQRYEKIKVEDFDGAQKHLNSEELIASIIRSGESFEVAIGITERILKEKERCKSMRDIQKMVVEELTDRKSWKSLKYYLEKNPIGIKICGGDYDDQLFTYEIGKKILLKHLSHFGIKYLPAEVCREVLHPILKLFMNKMKTEGTTNEIEIISKMKSGIFSVYRETLEEITQNPLKFTEKSKNFLESAQEKVKISKGNEAKSFLLSSFHWLMKSLYIRMGLLPAKDERATVYLTRKILSSNHGEMERELIEPKDAEEKIRSQLTPFLKTEDTVFTEFQKFLELIIVEPKLVQPSIQKNNVDFLLTFMDRLISTLDRFGGSR